MADKVMTTGVKMKMMVVIMATMMVTITAPTQHTMYVPDTVLSTLRHNQPARHGTNIIEPILQMKKQR